MGREGKLIAELEDIIDSVPDDALYAEEVIDLMRERIAKLQKKAAGRQEVAAFLVVDGSGIFKVLTDEARAHETARHIDGVVVAAPIVGDYRRQS